MTSAIGIVGSDGYTPIYQPDGRWTMWGLHEIYRGSEGQNKFVPKVDDFVIEKETGRMFRVASINPVTLAPSLEPIELSKEVTIEEITTTSNDNFRLYFDRSISPYTLAVDGMVKIHSSTASYARIYRGSFIDDLQLISRRYNNSGDFIGVDIPLDLVAFNSHDNYAIKSVQTCNTQAELMDGEAAIVAVFDSNGKLISRISCVCEETTFVAQAYAEQKFITNIYMKTAFIYDTNSSEISYPVNLPTQSFSPIGVVQYNDGSKIEYPVDGDKFTLYGLDQFIASIIGHRVPLVLSYRMAANESALASVNVQNEHFITRPYQLVITSPNTSYNAKLYVYPVWVDQITGYHYKVFLMNLDRNILFDVTNLVSLAPNSPSFNPLGYGLTQRLIFTVDLSSVSSMFSSFLHVQSVDIVLRGAANEDSTTTLWEVASQVPTPTPYYGTMLRASVDLATRTKVSFGNNFATTADFINAVYKTTNPLFNPMTETAAPIPTHMEIHHGNERITVDINEYIKPVAFSHSIPNLANIDITFLRLTSTGYLKLSVASMVVR
jgi:hypothetical protein